MFTGIVREIGRVILVSWGRLTIAAKHVLQGMEPGGSIAVNGACLTVTGIDTESFSVDVMPETLERTNLGLLKPGDRVNLEPPIAFGGELGGHLVQGHIDGTARVVSTIPGKEELIIRFETSLGLIRYVAEKGFVAVDGTSLTVVTRDANSFQVSVVGYTREHTTLGGRRVGDPVNLEVDIIAKYVAQFKAAREQGITVEFLENSGFLAG